MCQFIIRLFVFIFCAGLVLETSYVSAWERPDADAATQTAAGKTYVDGLTAGTTALFVLEIPEPGRLALGITVPALEETLAWIDVWPARDVFGEPSRSRHLERTLVRQILEVITPGTFCVRVGTVDPERALDSYALSVFLAPLPPKSGDSGSDDDTEDSNNEIVPLLFEDPSDHGSPCGASFSSLKSGDSGSDDDTEDSNNEIVPLNLNQPIDVTPACTTPLASPSILCARKVELGTSVESELTGGWSADFFSFTLDRAQRIRVESRGITDTVGVLYDASGHPLHVVDDGGLNENFAFTVQLPAGRYFVRVEEALGGTGTFRLRFSETHR